MATYYVGFNIARVPSASFIVLQFLQFPQIDHRKRKEKISCSSDYHRAQLLFCLVVHGQQLRPFTAVVRHLKLPLPRCARSDLPILTHLHPSFGHGSLPSIPTAPICHKSTIPSVSVGQRGPGTPSNSPRPKTLVLFTSYQKAILDVLIGRSPAKKVPPLYLF